MAEPDMNSSGSCLLERQGYFGLDLGKGRARERYLLGFLDRFLPASIVLTAVTFLVYVGLQQAYRQSANDPQIQLAGDAIAALDRGGTPQRIVGAAEVDIATSLAPFLMIWDASGTLVASSASLDDQWPQVPAGVLEHARQQGENRVTWQPRTDVRIATVVVRRPPAMCWPGGPSARRRAASRPWVSWPAWPG